MAVTFNAILARVAQLKEDFNAIGNGNRAFWIQLINEGYELDALEIATLGYLIGISK